jgi:hypothetical protein
MEHRPAPLLIRHIWRMAGGPRVLSSPSSSAPAVFRGTGHKGIPLEGPLHLTNIAVTSDQRTLLANSRLNSIVYAYSLSDLNLLGGAVLGGKGAQC